MSLQVSCPQPIGIAGTGFGAACDSEFPLALADRYADPTCSTGDTAAWLLRFAAAVEGRCLSEERGVDGGRGGDTLPSSIGEALLNGWQDVEEDDDDDGRDAYGGRGVMHCGLSLLPQGSQFLGVRQLGDPFPSC